LAFQEKEKESPEAEEFVYDAVLTREIFYYEALDADNIIRKSVEKEIRYVASYNKKVAKKKYQTRQENFAKTYEFVAQTNRKQVSIDDKYADIKNFLRKRHLTRFFDIIKGDNEIEISEKPDNLRDEEKSDGWFVVITLNKDMPKETVIEKYKQLKYVEHGFAELKHSIKLRPNFHWTKNRINAHVMVCFVAFQLASLLERRIKSLEMSWEKAVHKLSQIHMIEWTVKDRHRKGLTKTTDEQQNIFDLLGCQKLSVDKL
jgi:transposase